ncbi:NAC domain-containing protein [Quillaja saponaria]|uniref:NAC domain-containing protein n=1 Tax=Quillaja saponaria TaxID=32244 RepID=A0AAD7P603_QUISA|nr:NAC domain-containing protein [Quillaja saponaria]
MDLWNNIMKSQPAATSPSQIPPSPDYPAGFRFVPNDEQLLLDYLAKKVFNRQPPHSPIIELNDLYQHEPDQLITPPSESESDPYIQKESYYYFTPTKPSTNGRGFNRITPRGFWRGIGGREYVLQYGSKVILGWSKKYEYLRGRSSNGRKTPWVMYEYRLNQAAFPEDKLDPATIANIQKLVICKIDYCKRSRKRGRESIDTLDASTQSETTVEGPRDSSQSKKGDESSQTDTPEGSNQNETPEGTNQNETHEGSTQTETPEGTNQKESHDETHEGSNQNDSSQKNETKEDYSQKNGSHDTHSSN